MKKHVFFTGLLGAALVFPVLAQDEGGNDQAQGSNQQSAQNAQGSSEQSAQQSTAQNGGDAQDSASQQAAPYKYPDDSFITLSGTVEAVSPDSFVLSYGDGQIVVEMDDGDRDADAYALLEGDKVTVAGLVDDDFFELQTIEAASVYVDKIDTWFYASAIDEEDYNIVSVTALSDTDEPILSVQGRVVEVNGNEFTLDTGTRDIRVEVDELPDNPLDDEGYLRLESGDVISVMGQIDNDFLEGRELVADSLVKIHDNRI